VDPRRIVMLGWAATLALLLAKGMRQLAATTKAHPEYAPYPPLPAPAPLVSATILYSIIGFLAEFAAPLAAVLAVGYTLTVAIAPDTWSAAALAAGQKAQGTTPSAPSAPPAQLAGTSTAAPQGMVA
jgi:hypothetical protein